MEFRIPSKDSMTNLYNLVEELFTKKFFNFVDKLGQRIFFISSDTESYAVVITPDEFKIDIFRGQEGFLSCHNLFAGDTSAVFSYGINNLSVEVFNDHVYGYKNYCEKFKFYVNDGESIGYISRKPFQKPLVINELESLVIKDVLIKLLVIQEELEQLGFNEIFEEEMVFAFNFKDDTSFELNTVVLNSFDFFPNMDGDLYSEYGLLNTIKSLNVVPGVLHIGQVDSFKSYEICDDITEFDIGLTAIFLYFLTEEGDMEHVIYASPKDRYNAIFMFMISKYLENNEIYDTIITDNLFIYFALVDTLSEYGIEVRYEPNNDFNVFITKFMIKVIQMDDDTDVLDELLESSKNELKEILLENISNLPEFNEKFFLPFDDIITEEEDDFMDIEDDDEEDGFVS